MGSELKGYGGFPALKWQPRLLKPAWTAMVTSEMRCDHYGVLQSGGLPSLLLEALVSVHYLL